MCAQLTPSSPDQLVDDVARAISRYLEQHPDAADTAEGIRRWWIARQRIEENAATVAQAIEQLEKSGILRRDSAGDTMVYRLNPHPDKD